MAATSSDPTTTTVPPSAPVITTEPITPTSALSFSRSAAPPGFTLGMPFSFEPPVSTVSLPRPPPTLSSSLFPGVVHEPGSSSRPRPSPALNTFVPSSSLAFGMPYTSPCQAVDTFFPGYLDLVHGGYQSVVPNIWNVNVKNHVTTILASVDDFLPWKTQFSAFLVAFQLQSFVDGSTPMPPTTILDAAGVSQTNPAYLTWIRLDQCVRTWLFATLSKELLSEVHDITHSYQIWSRLSTRFNTQSLAHVLDLKRMLTNLQKSESQSMEEYVRSIKLIADSLASIRSPVSDIDLVQYTIAGLPTDYEPLITAATYFPGTITFDDLCTKLVFYEHRVKALREREHSLTSHQAFATTGAHQGVASGAVSHVQQHCNTQQQQQNLRSYGGARRGSGRGNRGRGRAGGNRPQQQHSSSFSTPVNHIVPGHGNNSSGGILGSAPTNLPCKICYYTGHPASLCPFRNLPPSSSTAPSFASLATGENNDATWYPDSAASAHMTPSEG